MIKKILKYLGLIILVIIGYFIVTTYPKLDLISGFASKSIASHYYIGDRTLEYTEAQDNLVPTLGLASSELHSNTKTVSSTALGLKERTAYFREGVGSVLIPSDETFSNASKTKPNRSIIKTQLSYPYGDLPQSDTLFSNVDYTKLKEVVNKAFVDEEENEKKTRSALVIYKGQIIAEQYMDGFDKDSKILGWSMAKSITSAVIGVMVKEGMLHLEQDHLFKEWENDERKNITLANLLQMNSGLEWEENYAKICDATIMLFAEKDMPQIPLQKELVGEPNASFNYSSGTSNLLSKLIRDQFDTHQEYLDYWYAKVIDKISMHSMLVETDFVGNYVGSSYAWATTRDWAKFGLLYLNNGNWNGEQVIDPSWVEFTKTPTATSDGVYGGHFWLNAGGKYPDVPKDMFSCNGFQGQRVWILPSQDLVIVRTGLHEYPFFDINEFLSDIIDTIKTE